MKKDSNIKALMHIVKDSVQHQTISTDYASLLDICRKDGISSYTLNLLIKSAARSVRHDADIHSFQSLPYFGWASPPATPRPKIVREVINKNVNVTIYKWGWKTWCLFSVFFALLGFSVYRILSSPFLQMELFGKILF